MIPPEQFHSCHHCQKFVIDIKKKQPSLYPSSDEDILPDIFFFDATLADVLDGLRDGCELCLWLDLLWAGTVSSDQERYGFLKGGKHTSRIAVCADTYSMSLVDRYPADEIIFFGLWERDAALHQYWGRCRVYAKCQVDIFTTRGKQDALVKAYLVRELMGSMLDDAASHLIQNRPINCFPGSPENLGLARQWLQECQTSHGKCRNISQTYMPMRILRISKGCDLCGFHVALETTTKNKSIEPFAALSYCWGGDQPYKTTRARMQTGDAPLQWRKLPRSIQDAVKTTAGLGLQCLVSDSRAGDDYN
jgi:hypothetical protein